jgi:K+-transporting ATPase ATPase B chain
MSQTHTPAASLPDLHMPPGGKRLTMFDTKLVGPALVDAFRKLGIRTQLRSPVMFVVYVGSIVTSLLYVQALQGAAEAQPGFILAVAIGLWFTVLFANFAEALAEGRSRAQAASLRGLKESVMAKKLATPKHGTTWLPCPAMDLRKGNHLLVEAGDVIPIDGEVVEGVASVDESAITGESAPVIRESGGDFSSVTGGTRILSDWLVVRVTANPGETFLDRMIAMVEGAKRKKTPNEIALTILLVALTIVFLVVTVTLLPFSLYSVEVAKAGRPVTITALIALLVCLIPTTIGGLLSAPSRQPVTSMCCCWTRPAPSPSATARPAPSCPRRASPNASLRTSRNWRRWRTRRRKDAASSCWPSSASTFAAGRWKPCTPASCRSRRPRG